MSADCQPDFPPERQLVLPLGGRTLYADFLPASSNAAARRWLTHPGEWPYGRLALWGPAGCGKTHLAHCWAAESGMWLQGDALPHLPELSSYARIIVDNAGPGTNQPALLHLLNACAEAGRFVLLTGELPPSRWPTELADLSSRLLATQAIAIGPPEDALLRALLARFLAERQLSVAEPVQLWLVQRLPRTAAALRDAAVRLDAASLASQQPITRALARANLSDLLNALGEDYDICSTPKP